MSTFSMIAVVNKMYSAVRTTDMCEIPSRNEYYG